MPKVMCELLREEQGQDLVEYTLLITFVLFAVAGIFAGYRESVVGITTTTNSNLAAANSVVHW
jgi:Flp pilus assembly pilin Flp